MLSEKEMTAIAVKALDAKQGRDIKVLHTAGPVSYTHLTLPTKA